MHELPRFEVRDGGKVEVIDVAALRSRVLHAEISLDERVRVEGGNVWAPVAAWSVLDLDAAPPPRHQPEQTAMPAELRRSDEQVLRQLRWWVRDGERVMGPLSWQALNERLEAGTIGERAQVGLVGGHAWYPRSELRVAGSEEPLTESLCSDEQRKRCLVCLERIDADETVCPECHEPIAGARERLNSRPNSQVHGGHRAGWLRMHWRPTVMFASIGLVLGSGVALRQAAPNRPQPLNVAPNVPAAAPACDTPCWEGESCEMGRCVWRVPNHAGQLAAAPTVSGPFDAPKKMLDALPLDEDRYAVSSMKGVHIISARSGVPVTLVTDAPQAQHMLRVGDVLYAAAPRRIYVLGIKNTRVLKTIETGSPVSSLQVAASGQRVLAAVPGKHAVAVIATDYHAEVSRFFFGDDQVRQVAIDHSGEHALTTNGRVPLPGFRAPRSANQLGALYAFDPRRLPSEQDRVRTGMIGNPADVIMTPDGQSTYVVLRERDTVVRLQRTRSGSVRQGEHITTCQQPEQIEMVRPGRRAIVRCNAGQAVDIIDLRTNQRVERIELHRTISDMAITPNGKQAVLLLPRKGGGAVGLLDLNSYQLKLVEISGQPHRVRLSPDGRSAIIISDSTKAIWVLR